MMLTFLGWCAIFSIDLLRSQINGFFLSIDVLRYLIGELFLASMC